MAVRPLAKVLAADPQAAPVLVILPVVSVCKQLEPEADWMDGKTGKPLVSIVRAELVEVAVPAVVVVAK